LKNQRCEKHPDREAAVCCPSCGLFFCRECVTEHAGKRLCISCLKKLKRKDAGKSPGKILLGRVLVLGSLLAGFLISCCFFYFAGILLSSIPQKYHSGQSAGKIMEEK